MTSPLPKHAKGLLRLLYGGSTFCAGVTTVVVVVVAGCSVVVVIAGCVAVAGCSVIVVVAGCVVVDVVVVVVAAGSTAIRFPLKMKPPINVPITNNFLMIIPPLLLGIRTLLQGIRNIIYISEKSKF